MLMVLTLVLLVPPSVLAGLSKPIEDSQIRPLAVITLLLLSHLAITLR